MRGCSSWCTWGCGSPARGRRIRRRCPSATRRSPKGVRARRDLRLRGPRRGRCERPVFSQREAHRGRRARERSISSSTTRSGAKLVGRLAERDLRAELGPTKLAEELTTRRRAGWPHSRIATGASSRARAWNTSSCCAVERAERLLRFGGEWRLTRPLQSAHHHETPRLPPRIRVVNSFRCSPPPAPFCR